MKQKLLTLRAWAHNGLNHGLGLLNLRLGSLSEEKKEARRIADLEAKGWFKGPAFPTPWAIDDAFIQSLLTEIRSYQPALEKLTMRQPDGSGFSYDNSYFSSPDVETLYAMLRHFKPSVIVEVGSGNSTYVMRQAIKDGSWPTRLIAVDPYPRADVTHTADEIFRQPVEGLPAGQLLQWLNKGGLLFIDSSHYVDMGNDVIALYLTILPKVPVGTLVHIHDIYLPYEYPLDSGAMEFTEQYLLQAILSCSNEWEILWPGYHLQKTWPGFADHFPEWRKKRHAVSFWMRKKA